MEVLDLWLSGLPLEAAWQRWYRGARYAGSSDRAAIRDLVYAAVRRRRSAAALGGGAATGRGLILGLLRAEGVDPEGVFTGTGHAPPPLTDAERAGPGALTRAERLDVPDWLLLRIEAALGPRTEDALAAMQVRADVHLRVNTRRADRAALVARLVDAGLEAAPHGEVDTAITIAGDARKLARTGAVDEGLAELQDAASQAVVARLAERPAARVLDYCAGGGGKALAFADLLDAEIVAHDIAPARMADLPARAARAGQQIATRGTSELAGEAFDLVFCDAPCSGSGSWRRDPEGKWRLTPARLDELVAVQAGVLAQAHRLVAPGGRLGYATCSVLAEENEAQAAAFLAAHAGWRQCDALRLVPGDVGDGFFLAVFERV
ncbi:NOL1/NOP2/sun family protein [Oceanicola granulosus HTCC2516]|uniref:NOL1/NOP2/sun family protein n=1 Tax=Oceanicola granulosus (strain ATCC BAA-861 / DSM 15982 / KCTC 12143 / HTCC2516) TaxID=314256 RepID=Q2CHP4_OCEGH|nr:RsmB/NOP family class I SAM-dependent RNA methyltransferase [Oceanicola granulosus]EAR52250.1 NOL1/NOP2/sun family protein [Oceanicola granulosus HTCC2516]